MSRGFGRRSDQLRLTGSRSGGGPAGALGLSGAPAAWRWALDAQIDIYRSDDSEYFRARAADLMDLRDRVVGLICGERQGSKMKVSDAIYVAQDLAPLSCSW